MPAVQADLILANANVVTMDPAKPQAQAVALGGGRILAVGSNRDSASWGDASVIRDMSGHTVLPGFHDSHNHTLFTGQNLARVDLSAAQTVDDVLRCIAGRAKATPAGQWVVSSSRWHETQLAEKRFPRREELDRVAPDHPVLIQRGGHNIVANSQAFQRAGITRDTPNPAGGTYVKDPVSGELAGHVIDRAMDPIRALLPVPSHDDNVRALKTVQQLYNQAGITSVIDPGLGPKDMAAYRTLRAEGELTLRANLMWRLMPGFGAASLEAALDALRGGEVAYEADDPWIRTVAIKLSIDGGVEAGFYREAYAHPDDPEHPRGLPLISQENFDALACEVSRRGWQMGTHCVGDAGIDMALRGYAAADRASSILGRRWTLIHMMQAREDHWNDANRLGCIVTAQQPLMFTLAGGFMHYVGPERTRDIEPLKMYLQRSTQPVGGGSDSPVTPYQPLTGIWSSVTRMTDLAGIQGPEWKISIHQALAMYTSGSACSSLEEHTKGSVSAGKFADLVVLDRDPRMEEPDAIKETQVLQTIVDGHIVYDRERGTNAGSVPLPAARNLPNSVCEHEV